jgi:hypothetical protein
LELSKRSGEKCFRQRGECMRKQAITYVSLTNKLNEHLKQIFAFNSLNKNFEFGKDDLGIFCVFDKGSLMTGMHIRQ